MYVDIMPVQIDNWKSIYEDMDENGYPAAGSIWAKRSETLAKIWPDWNKVFEADGVAPGEYADTIYVPPTLNQFTGFWEENVARAKAWAEKV